MALYKSWQIMKGYSVDPVIIQPKMILQSNTETTKKENDLTTSNTPKTPKVLKTGVQVMTGAELKILIEDMVRLAVKQKFKNFLKKLDETQTDK